MYTYSERMFYFFIMEKNYFLRSKFELTLTICQHCFLVIELFFFISNGLHNFSLALNMMFVQRSQMNFVTQPKSIAKHDLNRLIYVVNSKNNAIFFAIDV